MQSSDIEKAPCRVSVEDAVERELKSFGDLRESTLAASALALAREIDAAGNSATSKSMCARELRETLDRLRALAPPVEAQDDLDELSSRREQRLSGLSGAQGS